MPPTNRLVSLDAFRGFIMLLMASSGFGLIQMARANPDSWWWQQIGWQVSHVPWESLAMPRTTGESWKILLSIWDFIQPAFMFMVGVAVPYSIASRKEKGQGFFGRLWHALVRSIILILLAIVLSTSASDTQTNLVFPNVLAQIGLGYLFLFLLVSMGWEYCVVAIIVIAVGYWYYFFQYPLPGAAYDFAAVGANATDLLPGNFGHWSKGLNAAADFDRYFLNLLPRKEPFVSNSGGYTTLNFIPALATMLGGAVTGFFLQRSKKTNGQKLGKLILVGLVCIAIGTAIGLFGAPIVKRIWTPSWIFFSGGFVLLMLSFFYWLVEIAGQRWLVFPLVVVGMNSIFVYVLHSLSAGWISQQVHKHADPRIFATEWAPVVEKCSVLLVIWLLCYWLYRQRAFLRI
jgi:predicted acyltransferase